MLIQEQRYIVRGYTVEDIRNILEKLYQEYKIKGELAYKGEEKDINRYSHHEMARKFSEILNSLSGKERVDENLLSG